MPTRRSNRTRGTRPDKMRPDLRARQMVPGSNQIRGATGVPGVVIVQLAPGVCHYSGIETSCEAVGQYTANVTSGFTVAAVYLWEVTAGTAVIDDPTAKTINVTTDSGINQTFTLKVTVTENDIVTDEQEFTHNHIDDDLLSFRLLESGDVRLLEDGTSRRLLEA